MTQEDKRFKINLIISIAALLVSIAGVCVFSYSIRMGNLNTQKALIKSTENTNKMILVNKLEEITVLVFDIEDFYGSHLYDQVLTVERIIAKSDSLYGDLRLFRSLASYERIPQSTKLEFEQKLNRTLVLMECYANSRIRPKLEKLIGIAKSAKDFVFIHNEDRVAEEALEKFPTKEEFSKLALEVKDSLIKEINLK